MRVNDFMTRNPATCSIDTPVVEVARLMVEHDCGEIPVTNRDTRHLIGVVTDRDIVCRAVAAGRDTGQMSASECMTTPVVCVAADATEEECRHVMEEHQVRRVPVVDERGMICGIVAQADIARAAGGREAGKLVTAISEPTRQPSRVNPA
jgi:CBS-domain-containing membrane protein